MGPIINSRDMGPGVVIYRPTGTNSWTEAGFNADTFQEEAFPGSDTTSWYPASTRIRGICELTSS